MPGATDFTYSWDANKRKTAEVDGIVPPVNSQSFGYDDEDRLTSFSRNNGDSQTWNLSKVGDWNTFNSNGNLETRQHNSVHELGAINGSPLTYDPKGNLMTNSNGQTYLWDFENRMKQATVPGTPNVVADYAYDALGRRVSKTVGGVTIVFVNNGLQEIAEYVNGTLDRSYVYCSYIDEPLLMVAGEVKTYYHANNLYSVAALTDAAGAVVERYTYDPYGKVTVLDPNGVTTRAVSTMNNPWYYTGRRADDETGLIYYRARYYDVQLGRFIQRDPIKNVASSHLYEYVGGNPAARMDALGLAWYNIFGNPRLTQLNIVLSTRTQTTTGAFSEQGRDCYNTQPDSQKKCYEICIVKGYREFSSFDIETVQTYIVNSSLESYRTFWDSLYFAGSVGAASTAANSAAISYVAGETIVTTGPVGLVIAEAITIYGGSTWVLDKAGYLEDKTNVGINQRIKLGSDKTWKVNEQQTLIREIPCPPTTTTTKTCKNPEGAGWAGGNTPDQIDPNVYASPYKG